MTGAETVLSRMFTWPDSRAWLESAFLLTLFAVVTVPFGIISGLFTWAPSTEGLWQTALIALVLPALGEELVFRGPLVVLRDNRFYFRFAAGLLALFVLWHPLNAWLMMTEARALFTDPRFLIIAAGLGLTCTIATTRTGSLWPAIMIHWLTVVGWKGLFGGPQFLSGG